MENKLRITGDNGKWKVCTDGYATIIKDTWIGAHLFLVKWISYKQGLDDMAFEVKVIRANERLGISI